MNQQLVFTVITKDKPSIVTTLATIVNEKGGNWLDSRMSQLAGEFAGIVHIEIALDKRADLEKALEKIAEDGINISIRHAGDALPEGHSKLIEIEVVGNDRPGIVSEMTKLFSEKAINIVEFDTSVSEASMAGGVLFHANAVISVAKDTDLDDLQDKLHDLADDLTLDIEWRTRL